MESKVFGLNNFLFFPKLWDLKCLRVASAVDCLPVEEDQPVEENQAGSKRGCLEVELGELQVFAKAEQQPVFEQFCEFATQLHFLPFPGIWVLPKE